MEKPLVSVGIIALNAEKHIATAIRSIQNQTYENLEIIVIDDGSTDQTYDIVKSIQDNRIVLRKNNQNKGVAYSRNRYLQLATGKFLAVLDADDEWGKYKIEVQVRFMQNNPDCVACGTFANRFNSLSRTNQIWKYPTNSKDCKVHLMWGNIAIHSSILIRIYIINKFELQYNEDLKQAEDYNLYTNLITHGDIINIPEVHLTYNVHQDQLTSKKKEEQVYSATTVATNYLSKLGFKLSPSELESYKKIYEYKFLLEQNELISLGIFLNNLINQNHRLLCFDEKILLKISSKQWFITCIANAKQNYSVLSLFIKYHPRKISWSFVYQTIRILTKFLLSN